MTSDDLREEEIQLARCRTDPGAYRYFFEKYYAAIYRFCWLRTRDREAAEDLTSETFALALERLDAFKWQGVRYGAYLYSIALFRVREWSRSNRAVRMQEFEEEIHGIRDDGDPAAAHARRRMVARALDALPEEHREIFQLYYWEGLTTEEIATVVDLPVGTVRTRLGRGREVLKKRLSMIDMGYRRPQEDDMRLDRADRGGAMEKGHS